MVFYIQTPLTWAASHGNDVVTRKLLQLKAAERYKLKDSINSLKHTPLHWAAFKGHNRIVCLLLTAGIDPEIRDQLGNTALHQACAGGSFDVIKTLLSRGVDLLAKNARGHLPSLLCTAAAAHALLKKGMEAKQCASTGKQFSASVRKFLCSETCAFYCADAVACKIVLESQDSEFPEKIVTWALPVAMSVEAAESAISGAIAAGDADAIAHALTDAGSLPVSPLLLMTARKVEKRIRAQLDLLKVQEFQKLISPDDYSVKIFSVKSSIAAAKIAIVDAAFIADAEKMVSAIEAQQVLEKCTQKAIDTFSLEKLKDARNSQLCNFFDPEIIGNADAKINELQSEEKLKRFVTSLNLEQLTSSAQVEAAAEEVKELVTQAVTAGVRDLQAANSAAEKISEILQLRKAAEEAAMKKKKKTLKKK